MPCRNVRTEQRGFRVEYSVIGSDFFKIRSYRLSAIRLKFEHKNLSIEELIGWQLCQESYGYPVPRDRKLPEPRDIQAAVALPAYSTKLVL